jgi:hypothetical protein
MLLETIQEWSDFMKITTTWNFRSIMGTIIMGLVLAAMIGVINVAPAIGRDDHKRMERHDNGRYEHRGRGYEHGRYMQGRPYGYREPVYVPPRVIYAPPPPPGIGIFFPPIIIRP